MENNKLFQLLYNKLKNKEKDRMIIGAVGLVGSGKSTFSKEFIDFLKNKNIDAMHINMDLYNSSTRAERNKVIESLKENYDPDWPRRAYPQDENLIKMHLTNIKKGKSFSTHNLCDPLTKELNFSMEFLFQKDKVKVKIGKEEHEYKGVNLWVLCDGVKLVKYQLHLDYLIFLKAEPDVWFNRILERNKNS